MRGQTVVLIGLSCLGAVLGMGQLNPYGNPRAETPRGRATLLDEASSVAAGGGDASRGKGVFERRCLGCHAMDTNREGPRLADVFGRRAGTVRGFQYSASLKSSGVVWGDANLERWMADPDTMVPGNDMGFRVPKAQERKDIVAFLKSMAKK